MDAYDKPMTTRTLISHDARDLPTLAPKNHPSTLSPAGGCGRSPRVGRHRSTRPRTLHLVDLENLLAGRIDIRSVGDTWTEYRHVTGMRWDDHVVVAVSKKNAAAAFFALPDNVQRVVGNNGPDGADIALVGAVDSDWAAQKFGQVMMATGDHMFTETVTRLQAVKLRVVQVIGGGLASTDLYRQCSDHLYLSGAQRRAQSWRCTDLATGEKIS